MTSETPKIEERGWAVTLKNGQLMDLFGYGPLNSIGEGWFCVALEQDASASRTPVTVIDTASLEALRAENERRRRPMTLEQIHKDALRRTYILGRKAP